VNRTMEKRGYLAAHIVRSTPPIGLLAGSLPRFESELRPSGDGLVPHRRDEPACSIIRIDNFNSNEAKSKLKQ